MLLNAAGGPAGANNAGVAGNETEWQMVINLSKSRLGGIGKGGLMEGEPRSSKTASDIKLHSGPPDVYIMFLK